MALDNEQIVRQAYQIAGDKDLRDGSRLSLTTARSPTSRSASPSAVPTGSPSRSRTTPGRSRTCTASCTSCTSAATSWWLCREPSSA